MLYILLLTHAQSLPSAKIVVLGYFWREEKAHSRVGIRPVDIIISICVRSVSNFVFIWQEYVVPPPKKYILSAFWAFSI